MVKKRFRNQVKDDRNYLGADINSDHNVVMMKYDLKFKRIVVKGKWCNGK